MMVAALGSSVAMADVNAGQKFYLKMLKGKFDNMNGTKFAAEYTTDEWEDRFANNAAKFIKEYGDRYPSAKAVLENPSNQKKLQDVGDFAKEYSSDSGNVPSC